MQYFLIPVLIQFIRPSQLHVKCAIINGLKICTENVLGELQMYCINVSITK